VAKVELKPTSTTWLLLKDARPRLIEVLGSPAFAEIALIKWCAQRKVRWCSHGIAGRLIIPEGMTQKQAADAAQHELWTEANPPKLNWEESSAFKAIITMEDGECTGFTVYGIRVVPEDIEVQLLALDQKSATASTEAPASVPASTDSVVTAPSPAIIPVEPKVLFDILRKRNPQKRGERVSVYARRLHGLLKTAHDDGRVSQLWDWSTVRRALHRRG
jgi:hypothetical protein